MSRRPGRWPHGLGTTDAPGDKAGVDPPSVHGDADHENLLRGLVALWLFYLACALTFLLIGQVWANHHVMFDHIRTAGRVVLMTRRPSRNHHLRICRCAQRSAR